MSDLHKTLEALGPIDWSDVPTDNLESFLQHLFEAGELIANTVPNPPGGTDFSQAKPSLSTPDSASSSKEIVASEARAPLPHPAHADLQHQWGKPMKISPSYNPLGVTVYKMAGKDRNGAWFARRSVHEGISFSKFKKAMQHEFPESLAVQGGPGEGNVRGIGGDKKLEQKKVDGVGKLEVYQLSAQFPGPTTPREFIILLATSDEALTDKSSAEFEGEKRSPRHFMVVSKPCNHPDAPERDGFVRGAYESVELIREIPIHGSDGDPDLNPVEWIMITRSDPGGGIPRFMVERGTPNSICGDTVKFLDWACGKDHIPDPDDGEEEQQVAQAEHTDGKSQVDGADSAPISKSVESHNQGGVGAAKTASPTAQTHHPYDDSDDSDSSSDDSSSFASALEDISDDEGQPKGVVRASTDTLGASIASASTSSIKGLSNHDKELRKIEQHREKVEAKLAKKREAEDEKLKTLQRKDDADHAKAVEKHNKEVAKIEEKRRKELAKIESKREKERKKAEKRAKKRVDQDALSTIIRERDNFLTQVEALRKENSSLLERYENLQQENAALVQKLNSIGGVEAVKEVKHDI